MPVLSNGRAISWHAGQTPDRAALVHGGRELSWAEFDARSNRLARAYAELGVGVGDLVTIGLPNGFEFFEATAATWKLGATPQPVSARLPELERRSIVETANPALVVGAPNGEFPDRAALPIGFAAAPTLSDAALPDVTAPHVRCMTSGGSTGVPKLILDLTPGSVDPASAVNGMRRGGVTLTPGPLYHAGPFMTSWQCLLSGGTAVVMTRFDAAEALSLIETHRVDWVLFVPTMMQRIWRLPSAEREKFDVSSLSRVMCTGAPSPAWLKQAWIEWIGAEKIWEAYGGSERISGTQIGGDEWLEHPGSVGRPTEGRKLRILRPDGSDCDALEIGEIYMMPTGGQGSTYRYIGAEMQATSDGWETLGDLGHLDADGYLYLADRKTDMIVSGGSNVYPAEVEAALDAHPAVRSSAVVGLPDEDLGQRIHAIVDTPNVDVSDDTLREHLAAHLVRYKIPRSFEFVSEPLRDDAGKLRRTALRDARIAQQPS